MQQYADRGVFRGFRATPAPRGRVDYHFLWLLRRPMHAVWDARRGMLTFPRLFQRAAASRAMAAELKSAVAARSTPALPAHRRFDARRARLSCTVRGGDFSLAVHIRGANHEYATRNVLNLVNELFLALHERYPDYLIERFGLSIE